MKVVLYMAMSVDGYVAGEGDDVDWVSDDSWESYLATVKKAGCAIVGRKTYDLMPEDEFIEGCRYVVLTTQEALPEKKVPSVQYWQNKPSTLLEKLSEDGHKEVCVVGGGTTNASFMQDGLIDELILDVESVVLGKGTPLFSTLDSDHKHELLESKKIGKNTVQLRYAVSDK